MTILYVYPHPDDESFGVAHAMSAQLRAGHDVHLLTLTRGGATRRRHDYGYTVEEMGAVRFREMQAVLDTIGLTGMTVLDFPDSGLDDCDPRDLEAAVIREVERLNPDILVGYPVHGISGFPDHLVAHAVVKRAFVELRGTRGVGATGHAGADESAGYGGPRRLAFSTITEADAGRAGSIPLRGSPPEKIGCRMTVSEEDLAVARRALDCYVTFQKTIEETGIKSFLTTTVVFECWGERPDPPLTDLFERLP